MWEEIKVEFLIGFHDGWSIFWSPFVGLWQAMRNAW